MEHSNSRQAPASIVSCWFKRSVVLIGLLLAARAGFSQSVDPLTGRAIVDIPLGVVSAGDLSAPISLSYAGGGVKVNSYEESAGMNWALVAGGYVGREVRNLPDDFKRTINGVARNGWIHSASTVQVNDFTPSADTNTDTCADEVADWNTLNSYIGVSDTEPDLFFISAPGLAVQFVLDKNKQVRTIPYQDVKITLTQNDNGAINKITAVTNTGVTYDFAHYDRIEQTVTLKASSVPYFTSTYDFLEAANFLYYSSTWFLTSITSPTGARISFAYEKVSYTSRPQFTSVVNNSTNAVDTLYCVRESSVTERISSITGTNLVASFSWAGGNLSAVSFIDRTYYQKKKFNLQYVFVSAAIGNEKRAFLRELREEIDCNGLPAYQFSYYGIDFSTSTPGIAIPFNKPVQQDIFGYYNGYATSMVPDVHESNSESNEERYRYTAAPGYTPLASGGERSVNPSTVHIGSLSQITLGTGQYTTFYYEPSYYFDALTNSTLYGAGVRVKKVVSGAKGSAPTTMQYTYTLSNGSSSGLWLYKPVFAFADGTTSIRVPVNLAPDERIYYSNVTVTTTGQGKTVYEYHLPGMFPDIQTSDFAATFSATLRPSSPTCLAPGNLRSGYYSYPYPRNTNYDFERGLPKRISSYGQNGKVVSRKTFTYQRTTLPVAPVYGIQIEKLPNAVIQYGKYKLLTNVGKNVLTETAFTFDPVDTTRFTQSQTTYSYNVNQLLSQVTTLGSDNIQLSNHFLYANDYTSTGASDLQTQMITGLVTANRHGTLVETYTKNGSNILTGSLTMFSNTYGNARILPSHRWVLGDPAGFVPSVISGGTFVHSPGYYPVWSAISYDTEGKLTGYRDKASVPMATIYGYNKALPIAEVVNAEYDQVIYTDFESNDYGTINYVGEYISSAESWTGRKSYELSENAAVRATIKKGNSTHYIVSLRAKKYTGSDITVTIKVNSSASASILYPASASNTWQYLEQRIDVSSLPLNANLEVMLESTNSIFIDNLAVYPDNARMTTHAFDPLHGKTADIDSRGVGAYRQLDTMGRPKYELDEEKNVRSITEYQYKNAAPLPPSSAFTANAALGSITNQMSVTFTAPPNPCLAGSLSYAWYKDGVFKGSLETFTTSFGEIRDYYIKLVVTSPANGHSQTEVTIRPLQVFPEAPPIGFITITLDAPTLAAGESQNILHCNDTFERNLSIAVTGMDLSRPVSYTWQYASPLSDYQWQSLLSGANLLLNGTEASFSGNTVKLTNIPRANFSIRVIVNGELFNSTTQVYDRVQGTSIVREFLHDPNQSTICH